VYWAGTLPQSFHDLINELRNSTLPRREHCIKQILFGTNDAYVVEFENGKCLAKNLHTDPLNAWNKRVHQGWKFLSGDSSLCFWDGRYFLLAWEKDGKTEYDFNLPTDELADILKAVVSVNGGNQALNLLGQTMVAVSAG
jgi:hypothetical protein